MGVREKLVKVTRKNGSCLEYAIYKEGINHVVYRYLSLNEYRYDFPHAVPLDEGARVWGVRLKNCPTKDAAEFEIEKYRKALA